MRFAEFSSPRVQRFQPTLDLARDSPGLPEMVNVRVMESSTSGMGTARAQSSRPCWTKDDGGTKLSLNYVGHVTNAGY